MSKNTIDTLFYHDNTPWLREYVDRHEYYDLFMSNLWSGLQISYAHVYFVLPRWITLE